MATHEHRAPEGAPKDVSRRRLIAGAFGASALMVGATAIAATPEVIAETPIKAIWRRYHTALRQHHAMLNSTPFGEWTEAVSVSPMRQAMQRARRDMDGQLVTSVEDLLLKIVVVTGYLAGEHHGDLGYEAMDVLDGEVE